MTDPANSDRQHHILNTQVNSRAGDLGEVGFLLVGYCPMGCGKTLTTTADDGDLTCTSAECPRPAAAATLLRTTKATTPSLFKRFHHWRIGYYQEPDQPSWLDPAWVHTPGLCPCGHYLDIHTPNGCQGHARDQWAHLGPITWTLHCRCTTRSTLDTP